MFKFIKRFLLAWKLAKNPELLSAAQESVAREQALVEFRKTLRNRTKELVAGLTPEDRHAGRKALDVTLNIQCATICSPEEAYADAAKVIEESRVENKVTLANAGITQVGSRDALIKHNEKRLNGDFAQE
jgi:hypothetical protein